MKQPLNVLIFPLEILLLPSLNAVPLHLIKGEMIWDCLYIWLYRNIHRLY